MLTLLEGSDGFFNYLEVSWIGLGFVLTKNGKVISHVATQLKIQEKRYPTHDLEQVVVLFAIKIWKHYLYGDHVDFFTDKKSS